MELPGGVLEERCMSFSFLLFLAFGWNLDGALAAILNNEVTLEMESMLMDSEMPSQLWSNFLNFCKREINFYLI